MKENKNLVLFTEAYPFYNSETFLETEIKYLAKEFSKIYIIPNTSSTFIREIPENVEVVTQFLKEDSYNRNETIIHNKWYILNILLKELFSGHLFNSEVNYQISSLIRMFSKSQELEYWLKNENLLNSTFYSYWFNNWSTVLAILKSKGIIKKFIARAHGFDLYEDRSKYGFISFRKFQLKWIDNLFLISEDGLHYLSDKYPKYKNKLIVSKLGTKDLGQNIESSKNEVVVLSVSNIIPIKRLHLLVDALSKVNAKVKWIHFGDGVLMDDIKTKANKLPKNIYYEINGKRPNKDILEFLKNESVDIFANVSKSEGIPVSIMEAISFGIPIFATDAGGTREIVNDITGKLFKNNFDVNELANEIDNFKGSYYDSKEFRNSIREFWKQNFSAETNYLQFIQEIK